jgi:UDP-N-acetylglucosamine 1-carboxyvinyltransferase
MAQIVIEHDGQPLSGTIHVDGGKHAFAHSLACAALGECGRMTAVPDHVDARTLREALALVFSRVEYDRASRVLTFGQPTSSSRVTLNAELASRSRSLFCLLPALLLRAEEVVVEAAPQGCRIGERPTGWYLQVLSQFGVRSRVEEGSTFLSWPTRHAAELAFAYPTMTGTVIALASAAVSPGRSIVRHASVEPSCTEQLACLRAMGAVVVGELPEVTIEGRAYGRVDWAVAPDRIHAVTYLTAGLLTRGDVTVTGTAPLRIPRFVEFLRSSGVTVDDASERITASFPGDKPLRAVCVEAGSEPLFSSDWVTFASLLLACRSRGRSVISDDVFMGRFQYIENLRPKGITGVRLSRTTRGDREAIAAVIDPNAGQLRSGNLGACADIRGSAALVLASLTADGPCTVGDDFHIRRGYTDLPGDLVALGAGHLTVRTEEDSA